jgi:hypothetical protein
VLFPALCRGQGPVAVVSNHLERQYRPMHKGGASSPVIRERGETSSTSWNPALRGCRCLDHCRSANGKDQGSQVLAQHVLPNFRLPYVGYSGEPSFRKVSICSTNQRHTRCSPTPGAITCASLKTKLMSTKYARYNQGRCLCPSGQRRGNK